jgi:hypothetical protein
MFMAVALQTTVSCKYSSNGNEREAEWVVKDAKIQSNISDGYLLIYVVLAASISLRIQALLKLPAVSLTS